MYISADQLSVGKTARSIDFSLSIKALADDVIDGTDLLNCPLIGVDMIDGSLIRSLSWCCDNIVDAVTANMFGTRLITLWKRGLSDWNRFCPIRRWHFGSLIREYDN